jgi:hypothetical protein
LVIATGFSGLGADCLEETLRPEASVNFTDTNRTSAGFLNPNPNPNPNPYVTHTSDTRLTKKLGFLF